MYSKPKNWANIVKSITSKPDIKERWSREKETPNSKNSQEYKKRPKSIKKTEDEFSKFKYKNTRIRKATKRDVKEKAKRPTGPNHFLKKQIKVEFPSRINKTLKLYKHEGAKVELQLNKKTQISICMFEKMN